MFADGPGCSGQIGHSGNGGQYVHFNLTSANDGERFVCPKCRKSYAYKGNLNKHMDKMLKNIDRYPCGTCERVFTGGGRSRYQYHVAAHAGVRRHTISICDVIVNFTNYSESARFTLSSKQGCIFIQYVVNSAKCFVDKKCN